MKHINHIIFILSLFIPCLSQAMLHQAARESNQLEQSREFIIHAKIKDVNTPAEWLPPLHQAARDSNQLKQLRELLINATIEDANAPAECGFTPLHCAAIKGNKEQVSLLLAHGANVKAVTVIKRTPLHFAAIWGHTDIAELLINNGAEINAEDSDGYTPLESAQANDHENLALLLRNKGAKLGSMDDLQKQCKDLLKEIKREKEKSNKSLQN